MEFRTGSLVLSMAVRCLALMAVQHCKSHPVSLLQFALGIMIRISTKAWWSSRLPLHEQRREIMSHTRKRTRTALATFCGLVALLSGSVAMEVLSAAIATAAPVNIDPAAYQGQWRVDGAWHRGPATLDLSPGTHQFT